MPEEQGQQQQTPPADGGQPPPPPPPTPPPTPPPPRTFTISETDYQEFMANRQKLAEIESQRQREVAEAQRREFEAKVKEGQVKEALDTLRSQTAAEIETERGRLRDAQRRAERYALKGELSRALAAQPLVSPSAADQLTALWEPQLTAEPQGDSFVVRTPTFQPVGEFVAQQLARPEFAHFLRPGTTGGGGGQQHQTPPQGEPKEPAKPKNLGDAAIMDALARQKAAGSPLENQDIPMWGRRTKTG